MRPLLVFLLHDGRVVLHSTHQDRRHAEAEYSQVVKYRDAALVHAEGGEITTLSSSVPFVQADRAFVGAVERTLGPEAHVA
jgi:hypothetical protein